jgi:hypothetical protein
LVVVEVAVYMLRATGQDGGLAAAAREQQTVALVVQVCQIPAAEVVDKLPQDPFLFLEGIIPSPWVKEVREVRVRVTPEEYRDHLP